ncbi:hypothetical protein ACFLU0_01810 [Chloroflexota bacterium]
MRAIRLELGAIFADYDVSDSVPTTIIDRLSAYRDKKAFLCIDLFAYSILSLGYLFALLGDITRACFC